MAKKAKNKRKGADSGDDAVMSSVPVPLSSEAPEAAAVVLTPAQEEEGKQRFVEEARKIATRYQGTIAQIMFAHWETGKFVDSLMVQPGHWGNATVQRLSEYLQSDGGVKAGGVSAASLYAYRQLFTSYPEMEQVKQLSKDGIGWWHVNRFLGWPKEERDKFVAAFPKLSAEDVVKWIDAKSKALPAPAAGKRPKSDGHKIRAILSVFGAISGICADLNSRMGELAKADKVWHEDEDQVRQAEFGKARRDMGKALDATRGKIEAILKQLKVEA